MTPGDDVLLLVSFHAPPSAAAAAARVEGLVRHLPEHGYRPVLVTSVPGAFDSTTRLHVPDIDIARSVVELRRRIRGRRPPSAGTSATVAATGRAVAPSGLREAAYSLLTFPDQHWPWAIRCIRRVRRYMREERLRPVAVFTTSPPEAAHLVGWALSVVYRVPWHADLRDLWSQNRYSKHVPARRWVDAVVERFVLRRATTLTTVTQPWADDLARLHGRSPTVVPNGIDLDAFEAGQHAPPPAEANRPLLLLHTGSLYGGVRDPRPLFAAVTKMVADGLGRDRIRMVFVGRDSLVVKPIAVEYGIDDMVEAVPEEPKAAALERQRAADALLLLLKEDATEDGTFPAKVFEYVAARRPVLGTGYADGVAGAFLRETGAGRVVSSSSGPADLVVALEALLEAQARHGRPPFEGDGDAIERWGQGRMVSSFVEVFRSASALR